jgi:hypothetical protein
MKHTKKAISMVLALALALTCWGLPRRTAAAQPDSGIMPCYNNAKNFQPDLTVDAAGNATLTLTGRGMSLNTVFSISSYLEQERSGHWVRVSNGEPNSTWEDVQQGVSCFVTHSVYVGRDTDCRAVITLTITGNGATDTDSIVIYATFY